MLAVVTDRATALSIDTGKIPVIRPVKRDCLRVALPAAAPDPGEHHSPPLGPGRFRNPALPRISTPAIRIGLANKAVNVGNKINTHEGRSCF